jgi:hypothetical protein
MWLIKCFNHKKTVWRKYFIPVTLNPMVFEKLEMVDYEFCWLGPTTSHRCRQNPNLMQGLCGTCKFVEILGLYFHDTLHFCMTAGHCSSVYTWAAYNIVVYSGTL